MCSSRVLNKYCTGQVKVQGLWAPDSSLWLPDDSLINIVCITLTRFDRKLPFSHILFTGMFLERLYSFCQDNMILWWKRLGPLKWSLIVVGLQLFLFFPVIVKHSPCEGTLRKSRNLAFLFLSCYYFYALLPKHLILKTAWISAPLPICICFLFELIGCLSWLCK